MQVKEKLHKIIDEIDNQDRLENYLALLSNLENSQNGKLFASLSDDQKLELSMSYNESLKHDDLIDHEDVKAKYKKWLAD